jgi:hypothetical protein
MYTKFQTSFLHGVHVFKCLFLEHTLLETIIYNKLDLIDDSHKQIHHYLPSELFIFLYKTFKLSQNCHLSTLQVLNMLNS